MPYSQLSGGVVTEQEQQDHDLEMASMPVDVRDGDDYIESETEDLEDLDDDDDETESEELEDDSTELEEGEDDETESEDDEDGLTEEDLPEAFKESGDPKSFEEAGQAVANAIQGTDEILASAIERGLSQEAVDTLKAEYDTDKGISEKSYKQLAEAGYTKGFVDAYIKGQESIAEKFVNSIIDYTGGQATFAKVQDVLANDDSMAEAFNSALDRNDVGTIKALIDSAKATYTKNYGKRPTRTLSRAKAPTKAAQKATVEPFSTRKDMMDAMNDKRYSRDATYRQQVEARLIASSF